MLCEFVRHKFATFSLLFAWLLATGGQWDLLQAFAWARMFTGYVQSMSVVEALTETFDDEKPCELCCAVREAKQQEKKELPGKNPVPAKLVLFHDSSTCFSSLASSKQGWFSDLCLIPESRPREPAVPPPRVAPIS